MKIIKRIVAFPFILILTILELIIRLAIKLGSYVGGIALLLLGICCVLALINHMWLQLGLLAGFFVAVLVLFFAAATVQIWVELGLERLKTVSDEFTIKNIRTLERILEEVGY